VERNVDEAASFVFGQLIEQEPSRYDKCHPTMLGGTKEIWLGREFLKR
jgi:hypothetical protein